MFVALQCYKLIYGYMGFAMFNVFFFLTGALIIQLLRVSGVHMDLVSFCFLLFNFSVGWAGASSTTHAMRGLLQVALTAAVDVLLGSCLPSHVARRTCRFLLPQAASSACPAPH
jgi:hypothetical protein